MEQSSVEGGGFFFRAGNTRRQNDPESTPPAFAARPRVVAPSIFLAIAVTALIAITVFVATDFARTQAGTRSRLGLIARHLAAEMAGQGSGQAWAAVTRHIQQDEDNSSVFVTDENGAIAASTDKNLARTAIFDRSEATAGAIWAEASIPGALGNVTIVADTARVYGGVWQRAGVLFGSSFLVIMFAVLLRWPRSKPVEALPLRPSLAATTVVEDLPIGLALWTDDGRLSRSSGDFCARLGLAPRSLQPGASYGGPVSRIEKTSSLRVRRESRACRLIEVKGAAGSAMTIEERPLPGGGFVMLLRDDEITADATRLAEDMVREENETRQCTECAQKLRAEAASRAKTAFLAHLSHDLRTPLNHIIGFADLLRHRTFGPLGDNRYEGYADNIKSSAEQLLTSLADILELAELEGGHRPIKTEDFKVMDIADAILERFHDRARRKKVRFSIDIDTGVFIRADRMSVSRMLGNLIDNALRFTNPGGTVTIATWEGRDGVVIEISDTGIGISAERLKKLGQPFLFEDAARARESQGTGLGLAIAKGIAELNGGELVIDSTPDIGTTVVVSLPRRIDPNARLQVAAA